jgi:glycosyltransferase involved in cell wall biosynthesis
VRVLFDGFWWVEGPFSNRQVQREFVLAWADRFPDDELALAVPRPHRDRAAADLPAGMRVVTCRLRPHGVAVALELPGLARSFRADVTIAHNFTPLRGRSAVFLHDVLFQTNPEWFTRPERLYYGAMPVLAPRAEVVFTSSRTEAERIRDHNPKLRNVVPVGLSVPTALVASTPERPPAVTSSDFLLCVARLNIRKNLSLAVRAALDSGQLTRERPLIILGEEEGKAADVHAGVSAAIADGRLQLVARASTAELAWLYENARALIFPSLDEGFGLPPIEALHFGTPVIASDIPVLRENLTRYATYADPTDPAAFAGAIREVCAGPKRRVVLPPGTLATWQHSVELMRAAIVH